MFNILLLCILVSIGISYSTLLFSLGWLGIKGAFILSIAFLSTQALVVLLLSYIAHAISKNSRNWLHYLFFVFIFTYITLLSALYLLNFIFLGNIGQAISLGLFVNMLIVSPEYLWPYKQYLVLTIPLFLYIGYLVKRHARAIITHAGSIWENKRVLKAYALMLVLFAGIVGTFLAYGSNGLRFYYYYDPIAGIFQGILKPDYTSVSELATFKPDSIAPKRKSNVIIITADALRAQNLDIYGYHRATSPFISTLVKKGATAIKWAFSACSKTSCGVMSILGSRDTRDIKIGDLKIYEVLKLHGYETFFYGSGIHKSYDLLGDHYGNSIDHFNEFNMSTDASIIESLKNIPAFDAKTSEPAFFYFHLMSSHISGKKYPQYERFKPAKHYLNNLFAKNKPTSPRLYSQRVDGTKQEYTNFYDNGVIQADDYIRQIYGILKDKHYLDDAIVVILADHGEGLGDRGDTYFGHASEMYQELMHIPMIFIDTKEPLHLANSYYAIQDDVGPTIVDRLGITVPKQWEGISLLDPKQRTESFHQDVWYATDIPDDINVMISRKKDKLYKLMRIHRRDEINYELYELTSDPLETHNLIDNAAVDVPSMKERLDAYASHGR
ncbi:MAG: hypothetical protein EB060_06785 [Proteobacteria bacterium]|nr:hypothetical protein [Pseudomonadota bacterium]